VMYIAQLCPDCYRANKFFEANNTPCLNIRFEGNHEATMIFDGQEADSHHPHSQYFSGNHFFINTNKAKITTSINSELTSTHAIRSLDTST
jgi:hypothetical protein